MMADGFRNPEDREQEACRAGVCKMLLDVQEGRWFGEQFKQKTLKEMFDRYEKEYTVIKPYYQKARDKSIFKTCTAFLVKIVLSAKSKISSVAMKYTDAIRA